MNKRHLAWKLLLASVTVSANGVAGLAAAQAGGGGPVRMARVAYMTGGPADWRPISNIGWSHASINLPVREGAQIWTPKGRRAELIFDDGTAVRVANNGVITLKTLYSDSSGEYTELKLTEGEATLNIRHDYSIYQVDTPCTSVRITGPAKVDISADQGCRVADRGWKPVDLESPSGRPMRLAPGQQVVVEPSGSYDPVTTYRDDNRSPDSWDSFNNSRDQAIEQPDQYLPSNIGLVAGDLNDYGDWRHTSNYGDVWYPRVHRRGWRPYHDGHWVWVDPVGWTWVGNEPWGWAPYHYGTWVDGNDGWGWVPGPARQSWTPAAVYYSSYGDNIAWAPLAPREVRYPPTMTVGFSAGDWSLYFSIGSVATYYPTDRGYSEPVAYDPGYLNRGMGYAKSVAYYQNYQGSQYTRRSAFVPVNSWAVSGATYATRSAFGGRGAYQNLDRSRAGFFRRGTTYSAPSGRNVRSGPFLARPTMASASPNRSFDRHAPVPVAALNRTVFHATNWRNRMVPGNSAMVGSRNPALTRAPRFDTQRGLTSGLPATGLPGFQQGFAGTRPVIGMPGRGRNIGGPKIGPARVSAQFARDRAAAMRARQATGYRGRMPAQPVARRGFGSNRTGLPKGSNLAVRQRGAQRTPALGRAEPIRTARTGPVARRPLPNSFRATNRSSGSFAPVQRRQQVAPQRRFSPPQRSFAPVQRRQQIAPQRRFSPPQRNFAPVQRRQRVAPQRRFNRPQRRFNPPQRRQQVAPQRQFNPPQRSFAPVQWRQGIAPQQRFNPPQRNFAPVQRRQQIVPQRQFNPPQRSFNPPQRQFNPPQRSFNPPQRRQQPPQRTFVPPQGRQQPPARRTPPPARPSSDPRKRRNGGG